MLLLPRTVDRMVLAPYTTANDGVFMSELSEPVMPPHPGKVRPGGCICLVGMAASGKTTIGRYLGSFLGWTHIDTDHVIEAMYGAKLQQITDALGKEAFLDVEARVVQALTVANVVLSTGGSVIYRQPTMDFLASLGPILHIDVPLPIIQARIARKPDRGLAINPGQTIEDLYNERQELYKKASIIRFEGSEEVPAIDLARRIACWLHEPE